MRSVTISSGLAIGGLSAARDESVPRRAADNPLWSGSRLVMRLADMVLAGVLAILAAPVWLIPLANVCRGRRAFWAIWRLGRHGRVFIEYRIATSRSALGRMLRRRRLDQAPVLWNILLGQMSFVGPRRASASEFDLSDPAVRKRLSVPPGLFCLGWLRSRANIAYGREIDADLQYVDSQNLAADAGVLLRSAAALLLGATTKTRSKHVELFGVRIDNLTLADSVEAVAQRLDGNTQSQVSFVNAHYINVAMRCKEHFDALRASALVFADGVGMRLAGMILGKPIRENVCGTDLFPQLCRRLEGTGKRVFLLGAGPGTAERVAQWIRRHYPGVCVCGAEHGYFTDEEEPQVIRRIRQSRADLLLVGFGAPQQEVWIRRRLRETRVKVAIGVGGLFDVCAGNLTRPPLWIREICMEWAYRLCHEPARLWRRYLIGNAVFLARALAHKMGFVRRRSKIAAPSAIHANPAHLAGCESRAA